MLWLGVCHFRWRVDGPSRRSRRGFTLIELLVVISIIGLLAGLLYPSLSQARAVGRSAACKANLRSAGTAFRMYLNESNDVMPVAAAIASVNPQGKKLLIDVLGPHLSGPEVLLCPADAGKRVFLEEKSSYEYETVVGGESIAQNDFVRHIGEAHFPILYDCNPFHGDTGDAGGKNFLFADLHVED
ncbi:MAG: type II secretion system protein [Phycisphaerae bacterium]|nr:type II secretion system protein [Phycisphaerae bacterium]